ncbi:hypothetical protein EB118_21865 [bacterium]|nr:hypothetical protein [bacterium]
MAFTLIPWEQPKMLLTDFQAKLRRIDTRLYIDSSRPFTRENGLRFVPLYLKKARKSEITVQRSDRNSVSAAHAQYLDALESGVMDTYITAICLDFIPEYDIFNMEYTKLAVMGWRSIGLLLRNMKIADIDRIKKAFDCKGLGESDYDRASYFGKLEIAKRLANV